MGRGAESDTVGSVRRRAPFGSGSAERRDSYAGSDDLMEEQDRGSMRRRHAAQLDPYFFVASPGP